MQIENFENHNFEIRVKKVILDTKIAMFYDAETKCINEIVNKNPNKFFKDYIGLSDLRSDLHFANRLLVDSPEGLDTANR